MYANIYVYAVYNKLELLWPDRAGFRQHNIYKTAFGRSWGSPGGSWVAGGSWGGLWSSLAGPWEVSGGLLGSVWRVLKERGAPWKVRRRPWSSLGGSWK